MSKKLWKCIRLPLSLALGQDHLEERRSKAAIWEGTLRHVLLSSIVLSLQGLLQGLSLTDLLISCFYLLINLLN